MAEPDDKSIDAYRDKRDFARTPEPAPGEVAARGDRPAFVVHRHDASRLHFDLRLEMERPAGPRVACCILQTGLEPGTCSFQNARGYAPVRLPAGRPATQRGHAGHRGQYLGGARQQPSSSRAGRPAQTHEERPPDRGARVLCVWGARTASEFATKTLLYCSPWHTADLV